MSVISDPTDSGLSQSIDDETISPFDTMTGTFDGMSDLYTVLGSTHSTLDENEREAVLAELDVKEMERLVNEGDVDGLREFLDTEFSDTLTQYAINSQDIEQIKSSLVQTWFGNGLGEDIE